MNIINPQTIKETMSSLRSVKSSMFSNKDEKLDFQDVVEVCRFIDISMMPLFYIWDNYYHRDISELGADIHLIKPYNRFLQDPLIYTWELYLFIKIGLPHQMPAMVRKKVLSLYEVLLMSYSSKMNL